jgi:hypothetical protein
MTKSHFLAASCAVLAIAACARTEGSNNTVETTNVVAVQNATGADGASTLNEVAPEKRPPEGVVYNSVLALNQNPEPGQPQLRGGIVARSADWPASLYAVFEVSPGRRAACTAALIGPQAVLTAGHCVPVSGNITIKFAGTGYPASCKVHDGYQGGRDPSADYALCKVQTPVAVPPGFRYESVSLADMNQLSQQQIILGGYGCISDIVANGQTDGLYRIGYNTIVETSNSQSQSRGPAYYAPRQANNLFTRDAPNLANLCPGDSGGPAFRASSAGGNPFASRRIVGVNSRVFYRDPNRTTYGASLVSATGGPDFATWAGKWSRDNHAAACGIGGGLPNCRS